MTTVRKPAEVIVTRVDRLGFAHKLIAKSKAAARIMRKHGALSGAVLSNDDAKLILKDVRAAGIKVRHEI